MKLVIDDMLANKLLQTWTNLELYEMHLGLGGELSRQQMTNLTTHLGDDIVVVRVEGWVSVVGFRELVRRTKSLKLVKDESVDEESFISVIRQVRSEARAVQHSNATWVTSRRITQSSKPVPRSSNWLQNWCPKKSQFNMLYNHITQARNQTTLGLAVKL